MLNEERIKLMVNLASYEEKEGKEDFKISAYYKKDYVSLGRWISMIWTTIGYFMLVGLLGIACMDLILDELTLMKLIMLVAAVIVLYLIVMIAYWVLAGKVYLRKHSDARRRVKQYSQNLLLLNNLYEKENM